MTKTKLIGLILALTLLLTGCTGGGTVEDNTIEGEITSISTSSFGVTGKRGTEDFVGYVKVDDATQVYDSSGERVRANTLDVGQNVSIVTGGAMVQLSSEDLPTVPASRIDIH